VRMGSQRVDECISALRSSESQRKAGVERVESVKGEIKSIPLPGNSVHVIVSKCVIICSRLAAPQPKLVPPGLRFGNQ